MAKTLIGNVKGPKGDTGAQGATGPQGPQGVQGTPTTVNGKSGASVTLSAQDIPLSGTDDKTAYDIIISKADSAALAPEEASATATRNYSIGDYLALGGRLYKVTAAIANGGAITPGTNCTETTVAEIASAINTAKQDKADAKEYLKLSVSALAATNKVIFDDVGKPGIYVQRKSMALNELLNTTDTSVHPAFLIGGATKSSLFFGKFQGKVDGSCLYSLPGEDPANGLNLDAFTQYCRNKGAGHHCITAAEWAFLALLARKNGTEPKGNNDYGKDVTETTYQAIPTYSTSGRTNRVATGTGPMSWSDTGDLNGIWDLNGNVWEWITGIRLVYGELQVIPYNDAALPDTDLSATSSAWRAINSQATGWDDLFIVPNGSGTTGNSIKLDFVNRHWQWQGTEITSKSDSNRNAEIEATTIATDVSAFAALYLRAMALAPESGDTDYDGDYFYANNGVAERCASRGGTWTSGYQSGVFVLNFGLARSDYGTNIGGRPDYYE